MKNTYHPRRLLLALLALLVVGTTVAACGDDDTADAEPEAPASGADPGAFPVTITHKYGTTTVPTAPERVVSVGFTDQDFLLALGVVPVGIRDWYGDQPDATWPWAQDELGDAQPEVLGSEAIQFEKVAALKPDLIVGVSSGMTDDEYAQLSKIAPTIPQSGEYVDYGMPWQEATRLLGQATGHRAEADRIVADTEARFAEAREAHPAFAGATANVGALGDGIVYAYGPVDSRGTFVRDLGFTIPDGIVELAGDKFYAEVSNERLDLLDTDVLVWVTGTPDGLDVLETMPVYQQLKAVKEGRVVELSDPELSGGISFNSPLSIPYVLDALLPRLDAALDGDPATAAN